MKFIEIRVIILYSILPKRQSDIKINLRQKYIVSVIRRDSILDCSLHLIIILTYKNVCNLVTFNR